MPSQEQVAAAKAEQAAMLELQRQIARRDRHRAAGFVEVVEMYERLIAEAYADWRRCSLDRARLTCRVLGGETATGHR